MSSNLRNILFLAISLTLILNYAMPLQNQNIKQRRKVTLLKAKIEQIEQMKDRKSYIEKVLKKRKNGLSLIKKHFYSLDMKYSRAMTKMQKLLQKNIDVVGIERNKLTWVEVADEEEKVIKPLVMRVSITTNTHNFAQLVKKLKNEKVFLYIKRLKMYAIAGKDKGKNIRINMLIELYRVK